MSSAAEVPGAEGPIDDRTTGARIRGSVVGRFAGYGLSAISARKVADPAGRVGCEVESGMRRSTPMPRGRAAVLELWLSGVLVLRRGAQRVVGAGLTDSKMGPGPALATEVAA